MDGGIEREKRKRKRERERERDERGRGMINKCGETKRINFIYFYDFFIICILFILFY
jgi:hypothetical protein